MKLEQLYKVGSDCEQKSWPDSSVGQSVCGFKSFSDHWFKSHSDQLSKATSKNPSVVNNIYKYIYIHIQIQIYIYRYIDRYYIEVYRKVLFQSFLLFPIYTCKNMVESKLSPGNGPAALKQLNPILKKVSLHQMSLWTHPSLVCSSF